eukprot:56355_1
MCARIPQQQCTNNTQNAFTLTVYKLRFNSLKCEAIKPMSWELFGDLFKDTEPTDDITQEDIVFDANPIDTSYDILGPFSTAFQWTNHVIPYPYHTSHNNAPYADKGCQMCINQRHIPHHTAHFSCACGYTNMEDMQCELCLQSKQCHQCIYQADLQDRQHWRKLHEQKLNEWEYEQCIDTHKQNVLAFGYVKKSEPQMHLPYDIPHGIKQLLSIYIEIYKDEGPSDGHYVSNDLRILILTLPRVLSKELQTTFKPIPLHKMSNDIQLKKAFYKCIRLVHPDRSSARNDSLESSVICEHIFNAMQEAYLH